MKTSRALALALLSAKMSRALVYCLALLSANAAHASDQPVALAAPRVEARSADLLVVGVVHGDVMSVHLSRVMDNAPVRDAQLTVLLRGVVHPAVAEADGGYTVHSADLAVPGSAAAEFQIVRGQDRENLKGILTVAGADSKAGDKNSARQLGWWVLNFAVCIGFLWLWSRRRKHATDAEAAAED